MRAGKAYYAAFLAATVFAACAQSNQSALPGANPAAAPDYASAKLDGRAEVSIRVPHYGKHAHYVSPKTASVAIFVKGKTLAVFNVTPSSKGCSSSGGGTVCTLTMGVPTGKVTFTVKTYDAANGKGSVLSLGSIKKTVSAGTLTYIPLTLQGVVATATVSLLQSNPPAGIAANTTVYVTAFDAAGAAIVGPGTYATSSGVASPLVLTDSDASGTTSFPYGSSFAGPGGAVVLRYGGGPLAAASIGIGNTGVTVTPATFAPTASIAASYAIPSPLNNDAPLAIAAGAGGLIYYTTTSGTNGIVAMTTAGATVGVLASGTNGLTSATYPGIIEGPDGNMWFSENSNNAIGVLNSVTGQVTEYPATGVAGTACPQRLVYVPSDGGMWFTSSCGSGGGIIGRITTAGVVTTFALSGGGRRMNAILLGKDGFLYVADLSNRAIGQVIIAGGVATAYSERALGTNPIDGGTNSNIGGMAQTADGTIWWTNRSCAPNTVGSLVIGTPLSTSRVAQYTTIAGCSFPAYLTVAPAGGQTLFVAESAYPIVEEVLAPAGGGLPTLTDVTLQSPAPSGATQSLLDITIGPDGNLWATGGSAFGFGSNIFKIAY